MFEREGSKEDVAVTLPVCDPLLVDVRVGEPVTEVVVVNEGVPVIEAVDVPEAVIVGSAVLEGVAVVLPDPVEVFDALPLAVPDPVCVLEPEKDPVSVADLVLVEVAETLSVFVLL